MKLRGFQKRPAPHGSFAGSNRQKPTGRHGTLHYTVSHCWDRFWQSSPCLTSKRDIFVPQPQAMMLLSYTWKKRFLIGHTNTDGSGPTPSYTVSLKSTGQSGRLLCRSLGRQSGGKPSCTLTYTREGYCSPPAKRCAQGGDFALC